MSSPEILVTGGTGSLGSRVAARLREAGHHVQALARSGGAATVTADLATGEGLADAVEGARVIVHCASNPKNTREVDIDGTERLLRVAERAGVAHIVFISIVGVDRNPYFPYYRAKLEVERTIARSSVPWTILRSTQFHEFVLMLARRLERLPVLLVPKGFQLQPIDIDEVADRLAELAVGSPDRLVAEVGGPRVETAGDLVRAYLNAAGRRGRMVEVPLPGRMARAWRSGAHVTPAGRRGVVTWEEFLDEALKPTESQSRAGGS